MQGRPGGSCRLPLLLAAAVIAGDILIAGAVQSVAGERHRNGHYAQLVVGDASFVSLAGAWHENAGDYISAQTASPSREPTPAAVEQGSSTSTSAAPSTSPSPAPATEPGEVQSPENPTLVPTFSPSVAPVSSDGSEGLTSSAPTWSDELSGLEDGFTSAPTSAVSEAPTGMSQDCVPNGVGGFYYSPGTGLVMDEAKAACESIYGVHRCRSNICDECNGRAFHGLQMAACGSGATLWNVVDDSVDLGGCGWASSCLEVLIPDQANGGWRSSCSNASFRVLPASSSVSGTCSPAGFATTLPSQTSSTLPPGPKYAEPAQHYAFKEQAHGEACGGGDILHQGEEELDDCKVACANDHRCRAVVSFTSSPDAFCSTCLLTTGDCSCGTTPSPACAVSASSFVKVPFVRLGVGVECQGASYYFESQDPFEDCETLCASDSSCTAFAWTGSGDCHACRLSRAACESTSPSLCNSSMPVYAFQKVPLEPLCKSTTTVTTATTTTPDPVVEAVVTPGLTSTFAFAGIADTEISVLGTTGFAAGDTITVGTETNSIVEVRRLGTSGDASDPEQEVNNASDLSLMPGVFALSSGLLHDHQLGAVVRKINVSVVDPTTTTAGAAKIAPLTTTTEAAVTSTLTLAAPDEAMLAAEKAVAISVVDSLADRGSIARALDQAMRERARRDLLDVKIDVDSKAVQDASAEYKDAKQEADRLKAEVDKLSEDAFHYQKAEHSKELAAAQSVADIAAATLDKLAALRLTTTTTTTSTTTTATTPAPTTTTTTTTTSAVDRASMQRELQGAMEAAGEAEQAHLEAERAAAEAAAQADLKAEVAQQAAADAAASKVKAARITTPPPQTTERPVDVAGAEAAAQAAVQDAMKAVKDKAQAMEDAALAAAQAEAAKAEVEAQKDGLEDTPPAAPDACSHGDASRASTAYPCTCGDSSAICTEGQWCNLAEVSCLPICSVEDGSALSQTAPCVCGISLCEEGEACNAESSKCEGIPNITGYGESPASYMLGVLIQSNQAKNQGGTPHSCSAAPTLPPGLDLSSDCTISGTPEQPAVTWFTETHRITATNVAGSATFDLSITVYGPGKTECSGWSPASGPGANSKCGNVTMSAQPLLSRRLSGRGASCGMPDSPPGR
eukprot:TRINITY_DN27763_c0_g1_i2.p1 TRINITY_DN27763_c0_g1~~TRINITY_DN27763_c0_g1_i2.p1  ORF type:complete len:1135 (+),score=239.60 TRINITY_DN27763_c0_g1_i2:92-3496(+)